MSYCRFSSDDWTSDIYCYQTQYGYTIHVASNRYAYPIQKLEYDNPESYKQQLIDSQNVKRIPIELEGAGESYYYSSPAETIQKLKELQQIGFNVPQIAFDCLEEEIE